MSPIFTKPPDPHAGPPKPLYERFQDFVFQLDIGGGTTLFRLGLFALLVVFVILVYTGTQFYGLRDAEVMDQAQLGRNLWRGQGYVTRFVRPLELWHLNRVGKPLLDPELGTVPELFTPPVYPFVLSSVFRVVNPNFEITLGMQTLRADRLVMVVSWLWFLVGLVLLYFLCRELFDQRVAFMSALMYLLCDPLLDGAASGVSINFMTVLVLLMAYGVVLAEKWQLAGRSAWWVNGALAASALAVAVGTLTQYAFVAMFLPLLVYVSVSFWKHRWYARVGLCVAVFLLVLTPWVTRNWRVSRTLFGLSRYEVFEGTSTLREGQLQRTYFVDLSTFKITNVLRKMLVNARNLYEQQLKDVGANYLIAFFVASLLHRYRREEVFRLRRLVFWSMMMMIVWLSVVGPLQRNLLSVFLPLVILYGVSFFYVVFERLQFRTRLLRIGMVGLFVFMNTLPLVFAILPPNTKLPYPPYEPGLAVALGRAFRADEVIISDIPWATAWYANLSTIWTPMTEREFYAFNDGIRVISGIYLTQATVEQQSVLEVVSGYPDYWVNFFRPPPEKFPLQVFQVLRQDLQTRQGAHVLITNRPR